MLGSSVGSYVITGLVGEGGMGVVYGAQHSLLGRQAAIKVLLPDLSRNQDIVNRFFNEARAATSIRHPGIIEVYDFGYLPDGSAYIAMEFLDGQSLATRLASRGRMPPAGAAWYLRQMAGALAAAHAKGIVHRDLKPDNVFLVPDPEMPTGERIKLLDFGIAKLSADSGSQQKTRTGSLIGTPTYMSPEQCRGVTVDHRSDIYAMGCILFEMLTGTAPFAGEGTGDILAAHIVAPPPAPSSRTAGIPPELDAFVLRLLAKDPAHRPQSCAELIQALDALGPVLGRPSQGGAASAPFVRPEMATILAPTPPPGAIAPAVPTTLSGSAVSTATPVPAPRGRGLWFGIGGAAVAAAVITVVAIMGGGGSGGDGSTTTPAPASQPDEPAPKPEPPKPEPVKAEPPKPEPVKAEPPEPVKPEPVKAELEPAKPEPVKAEPAKAEPAKAEPVKAEPPKPEPAKPDKVEPKVDPKKKPRPDGRKPPPGDRDRGINPF